MGATTRYDYAAYIKNQNIGNYPKIAELIRKGDISCLCQDARDLLADYLEGNKRSKGRPPKDQQELSEYLYEELESLKKYGRTRDKVVEYFITNATAENFKTILENLENDKMPITKARNELAKKEGISYKNIERLVRDFLKEGKLSENNP